MNKSRIGIWLIWLQVVFIAQQQACSLKKVANYHSTMKRKNFPAGLWNALLLPTESSQFKISYKSSMSPPPDSSDSTGHHNHWTNPLVWYYLQGLLQVQVKIAIDLGMQTRVGAAKEKRGPPILRMCVLGILRMIDRIIPPCHFLKNPSKLTYFVICWKVRDGKCVSWESHKTIKQTLLKHGGTLKQFIRLSIIL